ncbi:MAG: cation:proton antiporter [Acutalibacteraceae bacterium]
MDYFFLINIAIILISTKIFGLIFKKFHMPQVVGALVAGLLLGPAFLGVLKEDNFITMVSEIGVIVLMFSAGLETDINEFKKTGKASASIAILGVVIPLLGGFLSTFFLVEPEQGDSSQLTFLKAMFIGVILTATSVSITVETLKEMGKLNCRAGNAILGAAIIDDILGIVALTIISSFTSTDVNILMVLARIIGFFVFSIGVGFLCYKAFSIYMDRYKKDYRRFVILAFTFCLLMSWLSEVFGVADITGAYIAGLIMSNTSKHDYLETRFNTLSYMLLSPIFFASIGLKVELPSMSATIIIFAVILAIIAILSKMVGCGVGAKICGFDTKECLQIGAGMISRGEVALIVANKGLDFGLMSESLFAPIVIVVVATTIIAPVILKIVFSEKEKNNSDDNGSITETNLEQAKA